MRGGVWRGFVWLCLAMAGCASTPPTLAAAAKTPPTPSVATNSAPSAAPAVEPPVTLTGGELIDLSEGDRSRLAERARSLWAEVLSAAPERPNPEPHFRLDGDAYEIRLASWCSNASPVVAASDGLLLFVAAIAQAAAYDRELGKSATDTLSEALARRIDDNQGLAGLTEQELPRSGEERVLARQHQYFDSTLSFLFAHELMHWILPHAPCDPRTPDARTRARAGSFEPPFPEPAELEADRAALAMLRKGPFNPRGPSAFFRFLEGWERTGELGTRTAFQRASLAPALRRSLVEAPQ